MASYSADLIAAAPVAPTPRKLALLVIATAEQAASNQHEPPEEATYCSDLARPVKEILRLHGKASSQRPTVDGERCEEGGREEGEREEGEREEDEREEDEEDEREGEHEEPVVGDWDVGGSSSDGAPAHTCGTLDYPLSSSPSERPMGEARLTRNLSNTVLVRCRARATCFCAAGLDGLLAAKLCESGTAERLSRGKDETSVDALLGGNTSSGEQDGHPEAHAAPLYQYHGADYHRMPTRKQQYKCPIFMSLAFDVMKTNARRTWHIALGTTPLFLKSLCGGGVPSSHPSRGLSVFFLSFFSRAHRHAAHPPPPPRAPHPGREKGE